LNLGFDIWILKFDINVLRGENMPIYEYRCRKCGDVFERFMSINERGDMLTCPYCGEKKPEKILSGFSSSKKGSNSSSSCGSPGGSSRFS
jgi:putative FmdB family regulatory protein